ncbi:hypothetical protein [Companilactobacillus mishanensis]|uniref:Uncharacterized protein n=1 Tax=Companilactobacillus mishanensis TaxID=2486008 RepID=A0A5P0ZI37_9LACO|nr:hypothetical protein [Companilactobacillus mishanensis]MQS52733.1 hypothetical protein [Companilactobacillus mishanensis]
MMIANLLLPNKVVIIIADYLYRIDQLSCDPAENSKLVTLTKSVFANSEIVNLVKPVFANSGFIKTIKAIDSLIEENF